MNKLAARLFLSVAVVFLGGFFVHGYGLLYNSAGAKHAELVLESARAEYRKSGEYPQSVEKETKVLGILPGPELFYWSMRVDCVVGFSEWPFGPKSLKNCGGGDWYFEG
jgi:hypothetical protein